MKVEFRFEVEVIDEDTVEIAYSAAEGALMGIFGSESVQGDEPRVLDEENE